MMMSKERKIPFIPNYSMKMDCGRMSLHITPTTPTNPTTTTKVLFVGVVGVFGRYIERWGKDIFVHCFAWAVIMLRVFAGLWMPGDGLGLGLVCGLAT